MSQFSCLLVGDWGSGKTTAASTAPEPVLYLDVDNKLHKMDNLKEKLECGRIIQWAIDEPLSAVGLKRLATSDLRGGAKLVTKRPSGYLKLVDMVESLVESKCVISHKGKKVRVGTVVLDSYTTMDEHIRRLLTAVGGLAAMSLPLYGALLQNFEEMNNTLLRLPTNIIVICHERLEKDELSGRIIYRPLVSGQMSNKIGKDFEEVYCMEKTVKGGVAKYSMNTVGDSMRSCRTSHFLPARVEPNFVSIYKSKTKGGVT